MPKHPTCPHCNGKLESPIHLAVGSTHLKCAKCGREYRLTEYKK